MKRVFCLFLSLVMVLSVLPVGAMATGDTAQQTDVTSDIGLEGTNSFGNLLSDALEDAGADDQANGGYSVVGLQIEGSTATVEYSSIEDANLLVCIYTEDGMQLVASGNTTVSADEDFAQVKIEGEMPKYFMASAYLVDTYDFSPLCEAYDTPMYTQEMQELLASTVEDYDADKVVQLTDSTQTNFAVYNDSVAVIDGGEGVNTVASVDYENDVYIIENADEQITSLASGAIFAYLWAEEELLIVKVASIAVDGTTATITGAELELEDVFDHMKLETTGGMDTAELDTSTLEEGVTYEGLISDKPATKAWEGGAEVSKKLSLKVEKDFPNKAGDEKITVSGSVELSIKGELAFYLSWKKQFIEIKATPKVGVALEISGELTVDELSLGEMKMPTGVPGVVLEGSPKLVLQCQGKIEFSAELSMQLGIGYDSKEGFQNLCKKPSAESDIEISGKIFLGLKLKLEAAIIDEDIASVGISETLGVQVTGKLTGTNYDGAPSDDAESIHSCASCLDMSFDFVYKLSGMMTFLKYIKVEKDFKSVTVHLFKFYVSLDGAGRGFGSCPNLVYRTTLTVKDENGKTVGGASVATGTAAWGATNSNGVLVKYLPAGDYTVKAEKGELSAQKTITVEEAANVTLNFGKTGNANTQTGIFDAVDSGNYEGETIVEQGSCGENATWVLTRSGTLHISGTGAIKDDAFNNNDIIKKVVISNGITSIGNDAFVDCYSLTSVTIPDSVTSIGEFAFLNCPSLASVNIPDSVTGIGNGVFAGTNLTSVDIPNSVTSIGEGAFAWCTSLTSVTIPDSVTSIGDGAFYDCGSLTSVIIGDSVTSIGSDAFAYCRELKTIAFEGNAPSIGFEIFYKVTATAYYPAGDATWTEAVRQNYGGKITWVAYQPDSGRTLKSVQRERQLARGGSTGGVFSGEYSNEGTLRTASFADLVPGEEYLLLVLADMQAEDPLAASNLLFADQAAADENGKLVFTYIQRIETDTSYVMVCGASNQNLRDATITFPNMCADANGEHQVVSPEVVYDGETLVEGQDYVLVGTADYTQAGTYTCYIRGIYNYTGLVACTYEVLPWSWTLACDLELAALEIPAGQVLDLNGHTLIVDSLASFGQIIDSVGGGGLVAEDLEITANDWPPILDSTGCYRFCEYEVRNLGSKETANGVVFGFALDLADHTMLLDSDDVQVTVTLAVGENTQTYAFSKELIAKYVDLLAKYPTAQVAMQLRITGMDALEEGAVLTVTPGITAVGGRLENAGAAMTYTA